MSGGRGGRPRLEGLSRYVNGRIKQKEVIDRRRALARKAVGDDAAPASPRVRAERDLFNARCFKGGGHAQHAGDMIGQLWLVGHLDIAGQDATKLLAIARQWWSARAAVFADVATKTAKHEREPQGRRSPKTSKLERAYYHYEGELGAAPDFEANCLRDLMEVRDGERCLWASRIVQEGIIAKLIGQTSRALSSESDRTLLAAAKRALLIMAGREAEARDQAA